MSKKRVLVVGGTGYLGQHLLKRLSEIQSTNPHDVSFTYHSNPPPQPLLKAIPQALAFQVDLRTGHGFDAISQAFGQPHVVVNCAALSVPRTCEMDPTAAIPSTRKNDETVPVNVYGSSKVEGEQFISANCSNFAILRSSIIFGPQTVSPVPKSLPIQWMDSVLSKGDKMEFFHDEFRCPVYVKDVVTVILTLTDKWISEGKQMQLLLNIGGPDRVSRAQMAEAVAHIRGYNNSLITPASASTVDRGVKSPADISMDISKLIQTLGISPIPFRRWCQIDARS
ncbi:NAD(P)-binding Rossmann-fold superfamily protein [Actinidia rufa]|uniref:NAD(P)-binding Rossmann-fold superfamily protein n=1 Tax=Actinidia rufa TaxID=165716 RepID=A0A7J0F1M5_9ERIC|nr:NAD(P)-binding Rossmann-fold superfamily protein [Actinidia rufa]